MTRSTERPRGRPPGSKKGLPCKSAVGGAAYWRAYNSHPDTPKATRKRAQRALHDLIVYSACYGRSGSVVPYA